MAAIGVGTCDTVLSSITSFDNPSYSPYDVHFVTALSLIGILTEAVGEIQLKRFKDRPENPGEIRKSDLFSIVGNVS